MSDPMAMPRWLHQEPTNPSMWAHVPEYERTALLRGLWRPTPAELIAKLPKGGDRGDSKAHCDICGGYHSTSFAVVHLDYLGHSDTCRMIADIDPWWEWSPRAGWDAMTGEPMMIRNPEGYPVQMWIDLWVCGFRRPGIGTVEERKSDPEKELIGDAIRNAAMRFGIGADLWSKAMKHGVVDLDSHEDRSAPARPPREPTEEERARADGWQSVGDFGDHRKRLRDVVTKLSADDQASFADWVKAEGLGRSKVDWEAKFAEATRRANPGATVTADPVGGPIVGDPQVDRDPNGTTAAQRAVAAEAEARDSAADEPRRIDPAAVIPGSPISAADSRADEPVAPPDPSPQTAERLAEPPPSTGGARRRPPDHVSPADSLVRAQLVKAGIDAAMVGRGVEGWRAWEAQLWAEEAHSERGRVLREWWEEVHPGEMWIEPPVTEPLAPPRDLTAEEIGHLSLAPQTQIREVGTAVRKMGAREIIAQLKDRNIDATGTANDREQRLICVLVAEERTADPPPDPFDTDDVPAATP